MANKNKIKTELNGYKTSELQMTIVHHTPRWSDKLSGEDDYYTIETEGRKKVNTDVLGVLSIIIELIAKM